MFCGTNIDWSATAAWAQAVFAGLGIVIGAYIAARVAALPGLSSSHQRLAALVSIGDAAALLLEEAKKELDRYQSDTSKQPRMDVGRFDRLILAVDSIPLLEVSPGVLVDGLLKLQTDLRFGRLMIAEAMGLELVKVPRLLGRNVDKAVERAQELRTDLIRAATRASKAEQDWWKLAR